MGLIIQQETAQPGARAQRCRREPGRSGADNRRIIAIAQVIDRDHVPNVRLPCCVSMRMPSRTGIMQPCRLAVPSMVTRQSKQTPIRQKGPRATARDRAGAAGDAPGGEHRGGDAVAVARRRRHAIDEDGDTSVRPLQ